MVTYKDLKNKIRALDALCVKDQGKLLVHVLHHEWDEETRGSYVVDMKLCGKSLRDYIRGLDFSFRELLTSEEPRSDELEKTGVEIGEILTHVLQGLQFYSLPWRSSQRPQTGKWFVCTVII